VLVGDSVLLPKNRAEPLKFRPISNCAQTDESIKMPFGMEVGLSPGNFDFNGEPAPPTPKKGAEPPIFGPCLLWPNGCMDQDAAWYGGRPRPRRHCVRWGPSSPLFKKRAEPLPNFWPLSIVANRLDGSRCHLAWRWALVQATLC